jgi:hypothetical protein
MEDNYIIIFEGKTDTNKIHSIYPNLKIVETNVSAIDNNILNFIKTLSLNTWHSTFKMQPVVSSGCSATLYTRTITDLEHH